MGSEDAKTLLLRPAGEDALELANRVDAAVIAKTLGYLALAIIQAGATIYQKACNLKGYLSLYARKHQELLSDPTYQGADGYQYAVYTTWDISRGKIDDQQSEISLDAIELLNTAGFLYLDGVPEDIFIGASLA